MQPSLKVDAHKVFKAVERARGWSNDNNTATSTTIVVVGSE
jgi:hypothetical protein